MRLFRVVILSMFFLISSDILGQEIIKRVKNLVLININSTSGYQVGDDIPVLRQVSQNQFKTIGKVKLMKYAKNQCAGKIITEKKKYRIRVGDFVKMLRKEDSYDNYETTTSSGSGEPGSIGIEKGDSEISFMGFYVKMIGIENAPGGTGAINFSYGYFLNRNLQVGAAPQLLIYPGADGLYTIFSFSVFASYNFQISSKFIPYITVKWYQSEVAPGESIFMEQAYLTFGGGFRSFFNEYAALNTSISYGFNLGGLEETILTIMSGVSILF